MAEHGKGQKFSIYKHIIAATTLPWWTSFENWLWRLSKVLPRHDRHLTTLITIIDYICLPSTFSKF